MKINWRKITYIHKGGNIFEADCKDNLFKLKYPESFKGIPENIGFFYFLISKGCDIRYYRVPEKYLTKKNIEKHKNKFKLTLLGNFNILEPATKFDYNSQYQTVVGAYDSIADAMNVSQNICEGFIDSLKTGEPNNNFSRESKKLLIEKKDDVIFKYSLESYIPNKNMGQKDYTEEMLKYYKYK